MVFLGCCIPCKCIFTEFKEIPSDFLFLFLIMKTYNSNILKTEYKRHSKLFIKARNIYVVEYYVHCINL